MLAKLLRTIILTMLLIGGGVGYGWQPFTLSVMANVLVMAALGPFALLALIVGVSAVRSRSTSEPFAMWWRALWGEYLASVQVFLRRQPWTSGTPGIQEASATPASPPRVPVVLVHGYLCNHRTWDTMAQALRAQGHTVLAVNLEPLFTSIDHYAPCIEAAVAQLCQHTGASQVALVGHSMGGVAIRAWMRTNGTARVARVITLGTPHSGTLGDPLPRSPNSIQMVWHSDWLHTLSANETDATRALMRIALTPQDNIVYPQRAQVLPGVPVTVFEGLGHMQLCLEPQPVAWVCDQLASTAALAGADAT